jgi:hypothetical protein
VEILKRAVAVHQTCPEHEPMHSQCPGEVGCAHSSGSKDQRKSQLVDVLEQLKAREPLFHRRELVSSRESFDRETADDFWEVGASGQVYSRDVVRNGILERLANLDEDEMVTGNWTTSEHRVLELAADTFLFAYVLHGQGRVTRRSTIWRRHHARGWQALYHQGTVVREV